MCLAKHILKICEYFSQDKMQAILYRDNTKFISQGGYIKYDKTKHISSSFVPHDFQMNNIQWIFSSNDLEDLSTSAWSTLIFEDCIQYWIMKIQRSYVIFSWGGVNTRCTLFPLTEVLSQWVFLVRFLMRQHVMRIKDVCTLFPSLRIFFSQGFYLSKVLTRHIIFMDIQGGVL